MTVMTAILKELMAAGLEGDRLVGAFERIEAARVAPSIETAERPGRDRENKSSRRFDCDIDTWQRYRAEVFQRDEFRCAYCDADVSDYPQCDHVVPVARGGVTHPSNLATACKSCNSSKKDLLVDEWKGRQ